MKIFKPFILPSLGVHGTSTLISNAEELRTFLMFQNYLYLQEYKKYLPWYVKTKNCGKDIKIEVFEVDLTPCLTYYY